MSRKRVLRVYEKGIRVGEWGEQKWRMEQQIASTGRRLSPKRGAKKVRK